MSRKEELNMLAVARTVIKSQLVVESKKLLSINNNHDKYVALVSVKALLKCLESLQ